LLNELSKINGIEWIRLLYAYPSHFPDSLIYEIANNPKVCKYLDIPLQHISDKVLKSMRRGITKRRTIELINKLKSEIPDLILRTTFIVGYPAESHVEFTELCEFIEEVRLIELVFLIIRLKRILLPLHLVIKLMMMKKIQDEKK